MTLSPQSRSGRAVNALHYNHRWWQSIQENGLIIGDVRNDEGSQAKLGWLGQQEGNALAGTPEIADGLRKSIYLKLIMDSYSTTVHIIQFGCQLSGAGSCHLQSLWTTPSKLDLLPTVASLHHPNEITSTSKTGLTQRCKNGSR